MMFQKYEEEETFNPTSWGLSNQDSKLMDTARERSKLKNNHWLKLDQVTRRHRI